MRNMTKKHYEAIAGILKLHAPDADAQDYEDALWLHRSLCGQMATYFTTDNPKFDRARFLQACGVESKS